MDTLRYVAEHEGHRFEIIEGNGEGFYVFRYADLVGPKSTHDYLQDDVPTALGCAEKQFGVARNSWRSAEPGEQPAFRKAEQPS